VSVVRGRIPVAGSSRRAHIQEWRRESLWLWPALASVAACVVASVLLRHSPGFVQRDHLLSTNIDDARSLLSTIATALLTFTGVVFSITLVALQMASTQFTPRVLRTFVRKPVTKIALSSFIATFVYALVVLAGLGTTGSVPVAAVGLAFVMVLVSVLVFVVFVHSTVRSMRVTYVIETIHTETIRSINTVFPPASHYVDAAEPVLTDTPTLIRFAHRGRVLDAVEASHLVGVARSHGCVLRLLVEVGEYLPNGVVFLEVHGGSVPTLPEIFACLDLAPVRTVYQDARYGIRQLVDIAIRALSPAVNDPTTATQSIDRLRDILGQVALRPDPSGYWVDGAGEVRLVRPVSSWERVVELSLREIERYGVESPQISRRLMSVYDDLAECGGPARAGVITEHRERLIREVTRLTVDAGSRQWALTPDALGAG
jgi:uncharacterized membrane protein